MTTPVGTEGLLRELAPQALGAVVRRHGHFADAEDAVQEALLAAATTWPTQGEPDNPLGWLIRVASRRLSEQFRRDDAQLASCLAPVAGLDGEACQSALVGTCGPSWLRRRSLRSLRIRPVGAGGHRLVEDASQHAGTEQPDLPR